MALKCSSTRASTVCWASATARPIAVIKSPNGAASRSISASVARRRIAACIERALLLARPRVSLHPQPAIGRSLCHLEALLLDARRARAGGAPRESVAATLFASLQRHALLLLLAVPARERGGDFRLPPPQQGFALGRETRVFGRPLVTPAGGHQFRSQDAGGLLPRVVARLFLFKVTPPFECRVFQRLPLRLIPRFSLGAREPRRLELPRAGLALRLRAHPCLVGLLQAALRDQRELLVTTAQPSLFDSCLFSVDFDWKALGAALIIRGLHTVGELTELLLQLLFPAQQIDEFRRSAEAGNRVGAGVTRERWPRRLPGWRGIVEVLPRSIGGHQVVFFSIIWRMRSSRIPGGGTGTSFVRSRLEPSALYWNFEAYDALTVLTLAAVLA